VNGGTAPTTLCSALGERGGGLMDNFILWLLYSRRRSPKYELNRRQEGSQSRCVQFVKKIISCPSLESNDDISVLP
jgi:hypothetical protein